MMPRCAYLSAWRFIALALLILALALPKLTGLIADLTPGLSRAVICTGQGIEIIIFDDGGAPARRSLHGDAPCLLVDPGGLAAPDLRLALVPAFIAAAEFSIRLNGLIAPQRLTRLRETRAPPALS